MRSSILMLSELSFDKCSKGILPRLSPSKFYLRMKEKWETLFESWSIFLSTQTSSSRKDARIQHQWKREEEKKHSSNKKRMLTHTDASTLSLTLLVSCQKPKWTKVLKESLRKRCRKQPQTSSSSNLAHNSALKSRIVLRSIRVLRRVRQQTRRMRIPQ